MKPQGIKIDFSSKGVKRRRLFSAKVCLAAFIAVALTSYNIASYLKGRVELGRRMREAAAVEEFLDARGKEKDAPLGGIVLRRSPYWTTLLTRLEERLPDKAVISGIKGASKDNRVFITGSADATDKALLFVENLEKDNGFDDVVLASRASGYSIEARYRPPIETVGHRPEAGR